MTEEPAGQAVRLTAFERQLEQRIGLVLEMGQAALSQVQLAAQSLQDCDPSLARRIMQREKRINQYDMELQEAVVTLLAIRAPVASDLRWALSLLRMGEDLERIGDQAKLLAETAEQEFVDFDNTPACCVLYKDLSRMTDLGYQMLSDVLAALKEKSLDKAVAVVQRDRSLNKKFTESLSILARLAKENNEMEVSRRMIQAVLVFKAVEHIGDSAANIGYYLIYAMTGKDVRHQLVDQLSDGFLD